MTARSTGPRIGPEPIFSGLTFKANDTAVVLTPRRVTNGVIHPNYPGSPRPLPSGKIDEVTTPAIKRTGRGSRRCGWRPSAGIGPGRSPTARSSRCSDRRLRQDQTRASGCIRRVRLPDRPVAGFLTGSRPHVVGALRAGRNTVFREYALVPAHMFRQRGNTN